MTQSRERTLGGLEQEGAWRGQKVDKKWFICLFICLRIQSSVYLGIGSVLLKSDKNNTIYTLSRFSKCCILLYLLYPFLFLNICMHICFCKTFESTL